MSPCLLVHYERSDPIGLPGAAVAAALIDTDRQVHCDRAAAKAPRPYRATETLSAGWEDPIAHVIRESPVEHM